MRYSYEKLKLVEHPHEIRVLMQLFMAFDLFINSFEQYVYEVVPEMRDQIHAYLDTTEIDKVIREKTKDCDKMFGFKEIKTIEDLHAFYQQELALFFGLRELFNFVYRTDKVLCKRAFDFAKDAEGMPKFSWHDEEYGEEVEILDFDDAPEEEYD